MTFESFQSQIKRLAATYGPNSFSSERVQLIWISVKDLSEQWFKKKVDDMIGSLRQAPLVPDFLDAAREEKNRIHEQSKKTDKVSASNWVSKFSSDEEKAMAEMILQRLAGKVKDQDWNNFLSMLDNMKRSA